MVSEEGATLPKEGAPSPDGLNFAIGDLHTLLVMNINRNRNAGN
jgi:hypothetical protein